MPPVEILGLHFLNGSPVEAVERVAQAGGVLVVPAAPALIRLQHDFIYRQAMLSADYAIPDSGLMVLAWQILHHEKLQRVSGLAYLKSLMERPEFQESGQSFFVLPSSEAREKLMTWAQGHGLSITAADCHVAPFYDRAVQDSALLEAIGRRRPRHIVIAIGNGPQEKLGVYLRDGGGYRPAIHCIGAALGFLTGDQVAIPDWADRFYLGWLLRLFAQPRIFFPRLARAAALPWLLWRYGREMPPAKQGIGEAR